MHYVAQSVATWRDWFANEGINLTEPQILWSVAAMAERLLFLQREDAMEHCSDTDHILGHISFASSGICIFIYEMLRTYGGAE